MAIVTAAGSGIGRAIVLGLIDEGATVIANDIRMDSLQALGNEVPIVPVPGNATEPAVANALVDAAVDAGQRVDALFNNVGISLLHDAETFDLESWRRIIEVNLVGAFVVAQAVGREMIVQRGGAIVNTASTSGTAAMPSNSAYIASKHGVVGLTRALAVEWMRYGVRVNALCPGLTLTETVRGLADTSPELIAARTETTLPGRLATPSDQASMALFLASDDAVYVNGLIAVVDGGSHAMYSGYPPPAPPG